jgi:hypothetical protein
LVELATFVDYDKLDWNNYVLINIADRYFLNFNVAKRFNAGTQNETNSVTVVEPTVKGTDLLAGIRESGTYTIANFYLNHTLIIEACHRKQNTKGADVMVISIAIDQSLCQSQMLSYASAVAAAPSKSTTGTDGRMGSIIMDWFLGILALVKRGRIGVTRRRIVDLHPKANGVRLR